jgi:outer membrane protein TolC
LFCLIDATASQAATLSFGKVLRQALTHSWDLRIAEKEMEISRYALMEARSLYYPTLSVYFNNQYVEDFTNNGNVIAVGDQVVQVDGSTYQNSFGTGMSCLLYDFGARDLKVDNAKEDVRIAALNRDQALLETKLNVLEAFSRCLKVFRRLKSGEEVLSRRRQIYTLTCRLRQSGNVGEMEVSDAALQLAEAVTIQESLRQSYEEFLGNLGFLTGETYSAKSTEVSSLPQALDHQRPPRPEAMAEFRIYEKKIRKLKAEKKILQRSMLPTISLNGSYRALGSDPDSYSASLRNLEKRDASVAISVRWEIFNGFRDVARLKCLSSEVERLVLEKKRQLHDRQREMETAYQTFKQAKAFEPERRERENLLEQRKETGERLAAYQISDRITFLQQEIEGLEQRLAVTLERLKGRIAGLRLDFWQEGKTL